MANHKSALKRIKQTEKREALNRDHRTKLRHQMRRLRTALDSKDKNAAQEFLKSTFALIDHSTHRGVLDPNTAARYKSRLSLRFNALS